MGSAQKKPDASEAARLNNLGVALMNQQRMDKAVEKFDAALQMDPAFATAEMNKGIALLNLQKLTEAEAALKHAAGAKADDPRIWCNLGLLNRGLGKYEEGVEDFQKVVAIDPDDADSYYLIGSLQLQLQRYEAAIAAFQTALKINPLHASAEFGLARALQRSGKVEEAREHLHTFEHLTRDKISSAMTLSYGEQGRYSTAEDVRTGEPQVGPMIPVRFVAEALPAATIAKQNAGALGGGMCMIDLNGDAKYDLIILSSGATPVRLFLNDGIGKFKEASPADFGIKAEGTAISCAVGDFDNDGRADLAIALADQLLLFKNLGGGKFTDVTKTAGLAPLNRPAGLTFVDFDHDGDLDLFVTGSPLEGKSSANVLWRNNGNGTFTEWTAPTGFDAKGATTGVVLSDLNNDRAVDLLVTREGAPTFYANPREGKFKASPLYEEKLAPATGAYILDFNKDGWMDVALTHAGAPGISLWKNVDGKRFERVPLPVDGVRKGWGVTGVDFDNDGWIDLAAVVETAQGSQVRMLRNTGKDGFVDVSKSLGLESVKLQDARGLIASDVSGDGAADLIVTQLNAPPTVVTQ